MHGHGFADRALQFIERDANHRGVVLRASLVRAMPTFAEIRHDVAQLEGFSADPATASALTADDAVRARHPDRRSGSAARSRLGKLQTNKIKR